MKSKITNIIKEQNKKGRIALIPFITAGYPSVEGFINVVKGLVDGGSDVIEIGMPFSDPIAEGPTIQKSSHIAIENGINIKKSLDLVEKIRSSGINIPIVMMGYINPILSIGVSNFAKLATNVGVNGLIIADIPNEELKQIQISSEENSLDTIPLISLNSSKKRIELGCKYAQGFIYCISILGVTGSRSSVSLDVKEKVKMVKNFTNIPVGVGFGVSKPSHVKNIKEYADAVIVGSALIDEIAKTKNQPGNTAKKFISNLYKETFK
tara:strand:+ start:2155 stop:2952 length:798 start_codon:yes stop_codon:yes gene_type:complete